MISTSRAALKLRSAVSTSALREKCSRGNPLSSKVDTGVPSATASAGLVQPRRLALRGRDDHAGIGAGDHRLGEFGFDQIRLAGEGAVDDRIDLQFGGVGDHRHHVVERDLALAVGVERELASVRCARPGGRRRAAPSATRARPARCANSRPAIHRRSISQGRARRRDSRRSRPRSWRARRPCAAAIPAAARRPRSRCGNPSAAARPAYRRRWQNCASRRGPGSRGGRRTAASSSLHRPAATARRKARRRPASPAKTDRWDRRPRRPAAHRRARAPGRHRDRRAG